MVVVNSKEGFYEKIIDALSVTELDELLTRDDARHSRDEGR